MCGQRLCPDCYEEDVRREKEKAKARLQRQRAREKKREAEYHDGERIKGMSKARKEYLGLI
jgi:hypothetical protein